jgi:hypothetical protein
MSFAMMFSKIWHCASLLKTTQMLFEMTLIQSDASEFRSLGYFYLYMYVSYDYQW